MGGDGILGPGVSGDSIPGELYQLIYQMIHQYLLLKQCQDIIAHYLCQQYPQIRLLLSFLQV